MQPQWTDETSTLSLFCSWRQRNSWDLRQASQEEQTDRDARPGPTAAALLRRRRQARLEVDVRAREAEHRRGPERDAEQVSLVTQLHNWRNEKGPNVKSPNLSFLSPKLKYLKNNLTKPNRSIRTRVLKTLRQWRALRLQKTSFYVRTFLR